MNLKKFINRKNTKKYLFLTREINIAYEEFLKENSINIPEKILSLKNNLKLSNHKKIVLSMALAKIASQKVLGMTYYDVQLMGALALVDGCIAEMKTGEGKTLTCSAAVIANFALGYSTHVATANDYLAQRDLETLVKLYSYVGLKSSYTISQMSREDKNQAYEADVIYSTAQEFGFDFLRDNLIYNLYDKIQPLNFNKTKCIIDEADFILIDEARTPLIISGESPHKELDIYQKIHSFTYKLEKMDKEPNPKIEEFIVGDYWLDHKHKMVHLSDVGYATLEKLALESGLISHNTSLYQNENSWIIQDLLNALKAQFLYEKDKDYVIQNQEIIIIDQNTGRLSHGRTWSNGLHQAIEVKENLPINAENITLGTISIQNYFRTYCQISGMSGTIMESSEEFESIYNCKTLQISTNKPMIRIEHIDKIYLNVKAKYDALIKDILQRHQKSQPLLIGTTSVAESEVISQLLEKNDILHHVLNAKNNSLEAQIIAQAGQPYSVTVATSMAGRGTDIILGGNKEILNNILNNQLEQIQDRINQATILMEHIHQLTEFSVNVQPLTEADNTRPDLFQTSKNQEIINHFYINNNLFENIEKDYANVWNTLFHLQQIILKQRDVLNESWQKWREQVLSVGGLCVIGSSRNESRRIDDQLRGRAGRQGDPGESIFYLSTQDSWVSIFGNNPIFTHLAKTMPEDQLISSPTIARAFAKTQRQIEGHHFDSRKNTYQYDSVADEGRRQFLSLRNSMLSNTKKVYSLLDNHLFSILSPLATEDFLAFVEEKNKLDTFGHDTLDFILSLPLIEIHSLIEEFHNIHPFNLEFKSDRLISIEEYITQLLNQFPIYTWNELNSNLLLTMDKLWTEHLLFIEEAQNNVGLSSLAQKNPLYEYKKICFDSYSSMIKDLKNSLLDNFLESTRKPVEEHQEVKNNSETQKIEESVVL